MGRLFGTDGVRARAGEFPLNYPTVFLLGQSLAFLLTKFSQPKIIIGWDTRESSFGLACTVAEGILAAGGQVNFAGVIPTSAVSFLTRLYQFDAGVVISASHNLYQDNGIKIFQRDGYKLSDSLEEELETMILNQAGAKGQIINEETEKNILREEGERRSKGERERNWPEAEAKIYLQLAQDYLDFLCQNFLSKLSLANLKIVIDCANGASSSLARALFEKLGFKVKAINNEPNGRNINANCGALFPENLAQTVQDWGADLGVAYDGDADRAIFIDENGRVLNGDYTLFIQARFLQKKNRLRSPVIVATIMSNMGLEVSLANLGLKLIRTKVGDRYVLEEMIRQQASLGGERSGHTIFLDLFPTGDGLLTSLKMIEAMIESGQRLSELSAELIEFPQFLLNVPIKKKIELSDVPGLNMLIQELKEKLGRFGRIEVRYSGTEPVVRVMVEGENEQLVRLSAEKMANLIQHHLGG